MVLENYKGIYQMRRCKEGIIPIRMKFYKPSNPRTILQQANRQKYADGVLGWQSLTDEQKKVYNDNVKGRCLSGYNLYIKEYLLSH